MKRNYLIKVLDAKIVDVKRALEAKGIKLESIYEMYKEVKEPEKVATLPPSQGSTGKATGAALTEQPALAGEKPTETHQPTTTKKEPNPHHSDAASSTTPSPLPTNGK